MTPFPCVPLHATTTVKHGTYAETGVPIVLVLTGPRPRKAYVWRPLQKMRAAGWGRP